MLNGKGDVKVRTEQFKTIFRKKLNNWWVSHAPKVLNQRAIDEEKDSNQNYQQNLPN